MGLGPELGGWHPGSPGQAGVGRVPVHLLTAPPSPAPFTGVKQEQLSPRGQAGPPESLGVPTAQETSVLRGEAWDLPCVPSSCSSSPGRVKAGMGPFTQTLLRSLSSPRVQRPPLRSSTSPFRARGPSLSRL